MQYLLCNTLDDNYNWILYNSQRKAILFDCGDAKVIKHSLLKHNLHLEYIVITHSHQDHICGVLELIKDTKVKIVGPAKLKHKVDFTLDIELNNADTINLLNEVFYVYEAKGHCEDHLIYYSHNLNFLFSGDVLFNFGCGRIFDGSFKDMYNALKFINTLPKETMIFCGHNYIKHNFNFVKSLNFFNINEINLKDLKNQPISLEFEKKYNPFLNCNSSDFKKVLNLHNKTDEEFFEYLRILRNAF